MTKLPISLLFLCTTRGNWGRKNIYLRTLDDWKLKGFLDYFSELIGHVKVSPDEEFLGASIIKNMSDYGLRPLQTIGSWKHHDSSHFLGLIDDLHKLCFEAREEHVLILECDWVIHEYKDHFHDKLDEAMYLLHSNPDILCARIPRHTNDPDHFPGTEIFDDSFNVQNHLFSFNPCIMKKSVLYSALCLAKHNIDMVKNNSEVGMTHILRNFSMSPKPFASFRSDHIRALHIGTPTIEEEDQP